MSEPQISADARTAVGDVLVRYATGIDRRDWALLRTCFTDDCDADYGEIGHWRSGDEITAWMAETHEPVRATMHRISNIAASRVGGDMLTARSYVHAVVVLHDGSAVHAYGFYDDEMTVLDDGPRISRRRFTSVTTELHPPMG